MKNKAQGKRMSQLDILYRYYKSLEPSKKSTSKKMTRLELLNSQKRIIEQGRVLKVMLKYQFKKDHGNSQRK